MKIHNGIDIVNIPKISENLNNQAFTRKVFTPAEIIACDAALNPVQCYAEKFAAKEAFMKAIGQGIRQEVWFTQIEILEQETGAHEISVQGKAKEILAKIDPKKISVSISHSKDMVVAAVTLVDNA